MRRSLKNVFQSRWLGVVYAVVGFAFTDCCVDEGDAVDAERMEVLEGLLKETLRLGRGTARRRGVVDEEGS